MIEGADRLIGESHELNPRFNVLLDDVCEDEDPVLCMSWPGSTPDGSISRTRQTGFSPASHEASATLELVVSRSMPKARVVWVRSLTSITDMNN